MRLSVSNIAWDVEEDDAVAGVLRDLGVDQVDLAPGKYFPDPAAATPAAIAAVRRRWEDRGFAIAGMQALLFGTSGLNLFNDPEDVMLDRLAAVCRIGGGLDARALTFGSPRQRDRGDLSEAETSRIALDFFRRIGDRAAEAGVLFCLEPNPTFYGCNFMTTTDETAAVVAAVGHPAIRMQLDVGALTMNTEPVIETITRHAAWIGHVHASEPKLVTLGDGGSDHAAAGRGLRASRPELTVTIEMAASADEPHVAAVARAARLARETYGDV